MTTRRVALQADQLQAELRNQYEFLLTLVDTAPSLLITVDLEGRILNQNLAVVEASGYEDEELIRNRFFWDIFGDPENRYEMRRAFEASAPEFAPAEYENAFTNIRGQQRVIAWRSAPVKDASGEIVSIVAGGIDITERKHQEVELRGNEERLRAVIESSPVAIVEVDLENRVVTWNPGAERTFGWTAEEVVGRRVPVIGPEHEAESGELDVRIRAGAVVAGLETNRRRKDGTNVDVEVAAAPVRGSDGHVVGFIALYMDVTERKQRNLELQRERDATDTLVQTIPTLIVVVDENAHILVNEGRAGINRAFKDRLGWSDDEVGGKSLLEFIHPDDAYAAVMGIGSALNGVPAVERMSRWRRANGESVVVEWTATPMPDPSAEARRLVLISATDVTERSQHEEEIRASRTRIVQAGDDARRRLERNLHDGAQQRLVALSVSLRLAEAKLLSDPESAAAIITAAREELAHALEELRELARGIHPAVLTDRGLAAAVEALVTRTPLPVETTLPEERLPAAVEAALYYVVSESLANVVKYAGATSIHVSVAVDGDETVTAEVSDDGVGGADPARGSGLRGLADRVEALNGRLEVESPSGAGTRVRVALPLPAPSARAPVGDHDAPTRAV